MSLREQPLPIVFGGGIDTDTDSKSVAVTQLLDLQNATFKAGALVKRPGYEALSNLVDTTEQSYGMPVGIAHRGDEIIVFSNGRAYSYRESADRWALSGEVSSVVATSPPIARTGTVQAIPCTAVRNGVQVDAWEDSRGGVWCSVLEETGGRVLLAQHQLDANGEAPRCVYSGDALLVLWTVPAASRIWVAVIDPDAPETAPTPQIVTEDLDPANPVYDAESVGPVNALEPAIIAWARDTGGWRLGYLTSTGILGSPATGHPSVINGGAAFTGPIAVATARWTGANAVAVFWDDGQVRATYLTADALATVRTAALGGTHTVAVRLTACFGKLTDGGAIASIYWAAQRGTSRTDQSVIYSGVSDVLFGTTDADEVTLLGHELMTRAFYDGPELAPDATDSPPSGDVYVFVASGCRFFSYLAAARLSADAGLTGGQVTCVARMNPGEAPASHFRRIAAGPTGFERVRHLSSVIDVGIAAGDLVSRRHAAPLNYRIQLDTADGDQFAEIGIKNAILDFDADVSYQTAQLGRGLYLASACPQHYDGDRWAEGGYHAAPDWGYLANGSPYDPASAFTAVAGGAIPNGNHLYKLWYEDIDAQGETHQGPVSAPVLVATSGGNGTVQILIPTYKLTNKRRVRLCVARAITDAEGVDETIAYYRVTGNDPADTTGANCMVFNDPTVEYVSFDDALSDTDLIAGIPLYTNGGIRSNDPAPWAGAVITAGKNRLFWTDPTDPHLVRFSKTVGDDVALEAPSSFSLKCDPQGGPIKAIWVMDEAVYVGKQDAIFAFGGAGPADAPDLAPEQNFTEPSLITTDAGVQTPASVGLVPLGTIFKAKKGLVLLDRSRQIVPIGRPVYGYKDQDVTDTRLLPGRPHILALTSSGRSLLFDYERGQWSTYTNHEGWGAVVVGERYYYLRSADGAVYRETIGAYRDRNVHVPMRIETAWIKAAGYLQGLQSIIWAYFLGTYRSPHTLRVWFRLDYSTPWLGPIEMDVNTNYDPRAYGEGEYGEGAYGSGDSDPAALYQRRCHLNQFGQAIQFRIEDFEGPDDYGASFELNEMLLVGGVLGTRNMIGAARSS